MTHLACALIFFLCFTGSHIILFRLRVITFQLLRLLGLYLFWLGVGVLVSSSLRFFQGPVDGGILTSSLAVSSILFYSLACLWYLAQCTALHYGSPSLLIVELIEENPKKRILHEELRRIFTNEQMISPRLNELVRDGYLKFDGKNYVVEWRGAVIANLVAVYRQIIGREIGG
jgi:hypothetical protein